jgi:MFS family permease
MIVWMPIMNKVGRRPVGLISLGISTLAALGCAVSTRRFASQIVARFFLGFGAGGVELVGPLIVIDLFFVHQRGPATVLKFDDQKSSHHEHKSLTTVLHYPASLSTGLAMSLYSAFFYFGISMGSIVFGTMIQTRDWPDSYCLSAALLGAIWLLTAFTVPETAFKRPISTFHKKLPPGRCMRLWSGVSYTQETITTMLSRLFRLVCFPAISWFAILWGFQLAFLVTIVTNLPKSYACVFFFTKHFNVFCKSF